MLVNSHLGKVFSCGFYRNIDFPQDWIKPGEFQYCYRCGWYLIDQSEHLCASCKANHLSSIQYEWWHFWAVRFNRFGKYIGCTIFFDVYDDSRRAQARETHAILSEVRENIAAVRRKYLPPLFWVERKATNVESVKSAE